jgi:shikimate dehydrogenase
MTETTLRACIMGHPVAHSRSPMLHGYWLKTLGIRGTYDFADVPEADFPGFLRGLQARGFAGGNVTVPHKEAAFRLVDQRDDAATAIGAVNTVWHERGELHGGNTDAYGFVAHLAAGQPGWNKSVQSAVVLGAGGGARAIVHALCSRWIGVAIVNRTLARAQDLARHFAGATAHAWEELPQLLRKADLLVNATSLGMSGKAPLAIDLTPLRSDAIVYDIVYVPLETELLRAARGRGLRTVGGLGMLLHQAVPAFARWFGVTPTVTAELRAVIEADIRAKTGT